MLTRNINYEAATHSKCAFSIFKLNSWHDYIFNQDPIKTLSYSPLNLLSDNLLQQYLLAIMFLTKTKQNKTLQV